MVSLKDNYQLLQPNEAYLWPKPSGCQVEPITSSQQEGAKHLLNGHFRKKKELQTSLQGKHLPTPHVCRKAAPRRSPTCPSTSSPKDLRVRDNHNLPAQARSCTAARPGVFQRCNHTLLSSPSGRLTKQVKGQYSPQVCLLKGDPELTSTTCEHQRASTQKIR